MSRGLVEPTFVPLIAVLQNHPAHHRRQRQGNHRRNQNRHAEGYGKFLEQPPHHVLHEQQGNQYGDQRNRERENREADLFRALQGRLQRGLALFDIARDVFDHHNRVVDDEARRNGQGHQRQVIQTVAQQVHHAERAHQRNRHGHAGDGGGGQAAQKQENDHDDERNRQHQLELDIYYGGANRVGPVGQDRTVNQRRP